MKRCSIEKHEAIDSMWNIIKLFLKDGCYRHWYVATRFRWKLWVQSICHNHKTGLPPLNNKQFLETFPAFLTSIPDGDSGESANCCHVNH